MTARHESGADESGTGSGLGHNGDMTRIAIIGGHGKVALRLSALLTEQGHSVTSFIRSPDHAADGAALLAAHSARSMASR